jgi:protein-disulfide isomerase
VKPLARLACGALLVLALGACQRASADSDAAFGQRVKSYLLKHPEVIQQAEQRLEVSLASQEAAEQRQAEADLPRLRAAVERDPRDYVANPSGRITVTEFYDYRCPHCANAAPKVIALIRTNPDVRFVFKEMPIFGPTSEHAAQAAIAVKNAGGDYLAFYARLMATHPIDDATIDHLAQQAGALPAGPQAAAAATRQIAETSALFTKLALGGTPAFIIGNQIVYGEDMDAVNADVAKARAALGARS